jgi:AraC-like DNA-binding protein
VRHTVAMQLLEACRAAGIGEVVSSEHSGPPRVHRGLPSLTGRLVISLDAPFEVTYGAKTTHRQAVVTGLMRPGVPVPRLVLRQRQPTVYVDLSATTVQRLLGAPLSAIDAGGIDAIELGTWVTALARELASQRRHAQREQLMRVRLLEALARRDPDDRCGDALTALRVISRTQGRLSIDDVAKQAHLSPRHLRHVMRRDLGITPKFGARVARLAAALRRAAAGSQSWSHVAADVAYVDQSHFIHEFQVMMDTTPTGWLAEESRNLQGWRHPQA